MLFLMETQFLPTYLALLFLRQIAIHLCKECGYTHTHTHTHYIGVYILYLERIYVCERLEGRMLLQHNVYDWLENHALWRDGGGQGTVHQQEDNFVEICPKHKILPPFLCVHWRFYAVYPVIPAYTKLNRLKQSYTNIFLVHRKAPKTLIF